MSDRDHEMILWAIYVLRRYAPHPCADDPPPAATEATSTPQEGCSVTLGTAESDQLYGEKP